MGSKSNKLDPRFISVAATQMSQFLPSKAVAGSLHQCLFVCHQMFRKIVLGGTILLFVFRTTLSTKSFWAAVFLCHISIPNLFQATSNKQQITNPSSTDPCFISVTATLRGVSFHSQSFLLHHQCLFVCHQMSASLFWGGQLAVYNQGNI